MNCACIKRLCIPFIAWCCRLVPHPHLLHACGPARGIASLLLCGPACLLGQLQASLTRIRRTMYRTFPGGIQPHWPYVANSRHYALQQRAAGKCRTAEPPPPATAALATLTCGPRSPPERATAIQQCKRGVSPPALLRASSHHAHPRCCRAPRSECMQSMHDRGMPCVQSPSPTPAAAAQRPPRRRRPPRPAAQALVSQRAARWTPRRRRWSASRSCCATSPR